MRRRAYIRARDLCFDPLRVAVFLFERFVQLFHHSGEVGGCFQIESAVSMNTVID